MIPKRLSKATDKPIEGATTAEEASKVQLESPQPTEDVEEGEVSDSLFGADGGGDETVDELLTEANTSPLRTDEEEHSGAVMEDVNEITPEDLNSDKTEEGELTEAAVVEDGNDQLIGEAESSSVDTTVYRESKQHLNYGFTSCNKLNHYQLAISS